MAQLVLLRRSLPPLNPEVLRAVSSLPGLAHMTPKLAAPKVLSEVLLDLLFRLVQQTRREHALADVLGVVIHSLKWLLKVGREVLLGHRARSRVKEFVMQVLPR